LISEGADAPPTYISSVGDSGFYNPVAAAAQPPAVYDGGDTKLPDKV